jgi:hypothetical protein
MYNEHDASADWQTDGLKDGRTAAVGLGMGGTLLGIPGASSVSSSRMACLPDE